MHNNPILRRIRCIKELFWRIKLYSRFRLIRKCELWLSMNKKSPKIFPRSRLMITDIKARSSWKSMECLSFSSRCKDVVASSRSSYLLMVQQVPEISQISKQNILLIVYQVLHILKLLSVYLILQNCSTLDGILGTTDPYRSQ